MAEKPEKEAKEQPKKEEKDERAHDAQAHSAKKGEGKDEAKGTPHKKEAKALSSIIRLAGKDVNGSLSVVRAIDQVRGIGADMANAMAVALETKMNIPRSTTLGSLSEQQIEAVEKVIKDPAAYGVPKYMLNRTKDFETGKDMHLVSNELLFATRQDVNRDIAMRSWRGFRHQFGQKVRGQHTRSTGRTGTTVGVMKKAELAKQAPAKAGEAKPAAGAAGPAKKEEKKA